MPARKRDFIIDKGSDFQRQLYLSPGPDADIRNFTARMQIRGSVTSDPFLLELTTENDRITCDYGVITLNLANAVTTAVDTSTLTSKGKILEPAEDCDKPYEGEGKLAVYDLELISPAGIVTKYLYGKVCFVENITR